MDALYRGGWMDKLSRGGCRGGWTDALSKVVEWMRYVGVVGWMR